MKLIDKDAAIAEIDRRIKKSRENANIARLNNNHSVTCIWAGHEKECHELKSFIDTLEVKEVDNTPNIRFPHYKSIVEKVFGAGNLESFEYEEAEQLVLIAKEELLKDLEVKEVDLDKEIKSYFKGFGKFASVGIDDCIDIAKHFFELGIAVSNKALKGE